MDSPIEETNHDDHPLFGSDDHQDPTRPQRQVAKRPKRYRIAPIASILVIALVLVAGFFVVQKFRDNFNVADYKGNGQGSTQIRINSGDGASDVARTLKDAGVVASARAFVNAAKAAGKSEQIQPGLYKVPLKASAKAALAAILDPANRLVSKVTIPEGQTERQILNTLASATRLPIAQLTQAAADIGNLGLPDSFKPKTAEGVLFPATYEFDPTQSANAVVQTLTEAFNTKWVKLGMDVAARRVHLTPYQALIVASMVESEAKFAEDRPKIARVIFNRIARGMPLKVDAVNRYGAILLGLDPDKVEYATLKSPYNSYTHKGLPPTAISNPGEPSMKAAVNPAAGNWLYYVVSDAQGHHFFTNDDAAFEAAAQRCRQSNWGC